MTVETQNNESQATVARPMFFNRLMTLDRELHANLKFKSHTGCAFAARNNLIPITIAEFRFVARHYPIVFSGGPVPMPFAVVGLRNGVNLMVDDAGQWRPRTYVPAAVNTYPFILLPTSKDSDEISLVIDPDAPSLGDEGEALFVNGKPTPTLERILQLGQHFRAAMLKTIEFGKMIAESGLLATRSVDIQAPDGGKHRIENFLALEPEKIDAAANNIFLRWRKDGWLLAIFQYLQSIDSWTVLADVEYDRRMAAAAAAKAPTAGATA